MAPWEWGTTSWLRALNCGALWRSVTKLVHIREQIDARVISFPSSFATSWAQTDRGWHFRGPFRTGSVRVVEITSHTAVVAIFRLILHGRHTLFCSKYSYLRRFDTSTISLKCPCWLFKLHKANPSIDMICTHLQCAKSRTSDDGAVITVEAEL